MTKRLLRKQDICGCTVCGCINGHQLVKEDLSSNKFWSVVETTDDCWHSIPIDEKPRLIPDYRPPGE